MGQIAGVGQASEDVLAGKAGVIEQADGKKTAFFLDGEDILLATEGMTVKKRYKIVRINAESVVIEDTEVKREQTLKISEDAGGAI